MIEGYLGNPKLKRIGQVIQFTKEDQNEFLKCAEDPIYFIKNYVKIVNVDRGIINFDMWPFQEDMVRQFHNNRFSICKMPRQVGKTTTTVGYMLWCVLFNENYSVAILANKGPLAREILGRLQYAYENLPIWLQQGIIVWNKGNLELENGSKIYAYATTGAGVRGGTYNCIFLDEFAFVPHNMAQEFFQSTYPVISSGRTTKVIIVSTPNGLNQFYKMWTDAIEKRSTYIPIEIHWSMVPGRDQKWREETIRNTSEEQFRVEFECEFIGSSHTLISGSKLRALTYITPIQEGDGVTVYEQPIKAVYENKKKISPDHLYAVIVDPSRGTGLDYSAISVIDVTSVPYKQVAKYRSNIISPLVLPNIIYALARRYNDAFVIVEINDNGQQVVDILHYDLEYENIFRFENKAKKQQISAGFKKAITFGLRTTDAVKKIGCANLKTLIESDRLIVNDFDTIAELNTFTLQRNSFAADEGSNDDLVMTLVLFAWMVSQKYFKESTDTDVRPSLLEREVLMDFEEEMTPFGFIEDGKTEDVIVEDGDVWKVSDWSRKGYFPSKL
jgi:hypothetical protein